MRAFLHLPSQPGFGDIPIAPDGGERNAENFSRFFVGEAAKEAQLDDAALLLVHASELEQSVVERDEVAGARDRRRNCRIESHAKGSTALGGAVAAGVVDKNLAHKTSRDSYEVGTVLRPDWILAGHAQVGFVNQVRGLHGVAGTFIAEIAVGQNAEVLIDKGDKSLQRFFIAGPPLGKQKAHRLGSVG